MELKAKCLLHSNSKAILATLILEAQKAWALDATPSLLGDETKRVNLKIPILFIIGEMQGEGKICCTTCHSSKKELKHIAFLGHSSAHPN
jgi:hypothetical protein